MLTPAQIANPSPLGLFGFGIITLMSAFFNMNALGSLVLAGACPVRGCARNRLRSRAVGT